jgi:DNA-binding GntR family transcriptional regulator
VSRLQSPQGVRTPQAEPGPVALTQGEMAYQALRRQIQNSELQPGSILSERMLAERLRIGKAPIRVAVQRLASEGFISVESRRGIVVIAQTIQDVIDLFQIRQMIEKLVVRSIAGKLRPDQVERLQANLAEQRAVAGTLEPTELIETDFAFHRLLCEFHGNRHMLTILDRILDTLFRELRLAQVHHPTRVWDNLREHEEVAGAVIAGPPEHAECLIEGHLQFGEKFLMSHRPR